MQEKRGMQRAVTDTKVSDWSLVMIFDEGIILEGDTAIHSLATVTIQEVDYGRREVYKIEG
jgi:hypothetical protein